MSKKTFKLTFEVSEEERRRSLELQASKDLSKIKELVSKLQKDVEERDSEIKSCNKAIEALTKEQCALRDYVGVLKTNLRDETAQLERAKKETRDLQTEKEGLAEEIHQLKSKLEAVTKEKHQLKSKLEAVTKEKETEVSRKDLELKHSNLKLQKIKDLVSKADSENENLKHLLK